MTSSFDGALVPDRRHDYAESVVAGTYLWTGATRRGRAVGAGQLRVTICSAFWTALQRFVNDGRLAIDNNRAENMLRIVAVGRNYDRSRIMDTLSCAAVICDCRQPSRVTT